MWAQVRLMTSKLNKSCLVIGLIAYPSLPRRLSCVGRQDICPTSLCGRLKVL